MKYLENQIQTPSENLDLVADADQNFGGKTYKNTVRQTKSITKPKKTST